MVPKFVEYCNQVLPDGAADSARIMELCAYSMCRSTMPACELSANDSEETMAI